MALTPRQRRFVEEYLIDLNATAAYKRVGYKGKGRVAESAAQRLLSNVEVQAAIQAAQQARSTSTGITAERVLLELSRIAFLDTRSFYRKDGTLKFPHELTADQSAALSSLEVLEEFDGRGDNRYKIGEVRKIKFWPKVEALKLVAQHLGMLVDRVEHTGKGGDPIQLQIVEEIIDATSSRTAARPANDHPPSPRPS